MEAILEHLPKQKEESFVVKSFDYRYFPTPWHYHPEFELVLVTASTGKRYIGDQISDFGPGNLALIGPNLPHTYHNDEKFYKRTSRLRARSIVVHFLERSLGADFLSLPESAPLRQLFSHAARGLEITGKANRAVSERMKALVNMHGLARWLKLVEILHILAETTEYSFISRMPVSGQNEKEDGRMAKVMDYVLKHFASEIRVNDVARQLNMADNSFSRYFSQRTRKTFTSFVNEVRLNHAAKLLIENRLSVAQICFECGFNNLSNFNKHFKELYRQTPLAYRKQINKLTVES
jgi:AraC-like DNA-binding protein